jgi:hypothetical protein
MTSGVVVSARPRRDSDRGGRIGEAFADSCNQGTADRKNPVGF